MVFPKLYIFPKIYLRPPNIWGCLSTYSSKSIRTSTLFPDSAGRGEFPFVLATLGVGLICEA